jgi:hypothetical protein
MKPLILIACFLPLGIIYIVMKLSVWIATIEAERTYVRDDAKRPHGPYVENPYADVDEEDEEYGSKTDYR